MAVHQRGWVDTKEAIAATFKEDPLVKQLVTRNMTLDIDKVDVEVADNSKLALLITYARYHLLDGTMPSMDHILAVSVGELVAPVLPQEYFLGRDDANEIVKHCLMYYMQNETSLTRGKTLAQFIAVHNGLGPDERDRDWTLVADNASPEDVVESHTRSYSAFLVAESNSDQHLKPVELFTTVFIAVAKRGNVSDDFINKVERGLNDDMQIVANLKSEVIALVYKYYGANITAANAKTVLETWLADLPEIALRVRLTLTQATNSGLTAFVTVGRAMKKYPDFPWERLDALTGGELVNYKTALTAVNGNPYYGFSKSLGAARSTLYSSIAYVAKELLIQLNGEMSLKRYAGWIRAPKSVSVVKSLIDTYKSEYTSRLESAELSAAETTLGVDLRATINSIGNADIFA